MRISGLTEYNIPQRFVNIWRDRIGQELLPIQRRAVSSGLLDDSAKDTGRNQNLIISAPTSSGKSFCAEMLAIKMLSSRKKVVMLFPLRCLLRQKYDHFAELYNDMGLRLLTVSSDFPQNDGPFARGDYHVAFAVYEKFDHLLTHNLDVLAGIGLVVVDELQTIGEPGRGPTLERTLTKVMASAYHPTLLGLSAVISGQSESSRQLAGWLNAELIQEFNRPVDLLRGVAAEGQFRYRSYNTGSEGEEAFARPIADEDSFGLLIDKLKESEGQSLIFLKSRHETMRAALRLASSVSWPAATAAVEVLIEEEPSYLVRSLRQAMSRGVAFHNSDLSPSQRRIIETAYTNGEIRAIIATTTLAMGVNLPADTVFLETVRYGTGHYGSRPTLIPVSRAEYDNMTGRAGRLGFGHDSKPGKAIVIAESEFDRDILWRTYIQTEQSEPIKSAFESSDWSDWLLNMIVSGLVSRWTEIDSVFERTLFAFPPAGKKPDFAIIADSLCEDGLVESSDAEGCLRPTLVGKAVADSGLSVRQAEYLSRRLAGGEKHPQTIFGWTALALGCPEWNFPPGMLTAAEMSAGTVQRMLYQRFDTYLDEARFILQNVDFRRPLSFRSVCALKGLMLLHEWQRLTPVIQLEEWFQLHLGQILNLGRAAAHLVAGLAALLEPAGFERSLIASLRQSTFGLRTGLPVAMMALHSRLHELLTRADFIALEHANLTDWSQLVSLPEEEFQEIVQGKNKFKRIVAIMQKEKNMNRTSDTQQLQTPNPAVLMSSKPELIEVDGTYEKERYLVRINGFPVRLTGKSFKYFAKLAIHRLRHESGWVYKEDIEIGFNQARYLYRMKNEIHDSFHSPWSVIENNRLGCYRLDVDPARIRIDREKLSLHPDHEVRSLMGQFVSATQN